jgi:hypothetical protein
VIRAEELFAAAQLWLVRTAGAVFFVDAFGRATGLWS